MYTKTPLTEKMIHSIDWDHEGDSAYTDGRDYWDITEVLHLKIHHIKQTLHNEDQQNTLTLVQEILSLLDEGKLAAIEAGALGTRFNRSLWVEALIGKNSHHD